MSEFKILIPKKNTPDQDKVYTPVDLASKLIDYFIPLHASVLDPCKGLGSFHNELCKRDDLKGFHLIH